MGLTLRVSGLAFRVPGLAFRVFRTSVSKQMEEN